MKPIWLALVEPKLNEFGLFHLPPLPPVFHCSCFNLVDPSSFPSSFYIACFSGRCAERGERHRSRDRGNASRLNCPSRFKLPIFGMRSCRLMAGVLSIWKDAAHICCSGFNFLQQRREHLLSNNLPSQGTIKPKNRAAHQATPCAVIPGANISSLLCRCDSFLPSLGSILVIFECEAFSFNYRRLLV